MQITIRELDLSTIPHLNTGGSAFEVRSKLVLTAVNGKISYTVVDVPPYKKQYDIEEFDSRSYPANSDKVVFLAYLNGEPAGQIRIRKNWNAYAYIDLIAVDEKYRGQSVGRRLMERAVEWAKAEKFPGMMLETQDTNVPACRFYESCGFKLYGFDTHLYKAQDPAAEEIALFWYLIF